MTRWRVLGALAGAALLGGCSLLFEPPGGAASCSAELEDMYLQDLNLADQDDPTLNQEGTLLLFNRESEFFFATREEPCQPWGSQMKVEEVGGGGNPSNSNLSRDGSRLHFSRVVDGHRDIFESRFIGGAWSTPEPVEAVNSTSEERDLFVVEGGRAYLTRGTRVHVGDLGSGSFQELALVPGRGTEMEPWVSQDELTLYLTTAESGASTRIYRVSREAATEPFADAEPIDPAGATTASDPWVRGGILYYAAGESGERFLRAAPLESPP